MGLWHCAAVAEEALRDEAIEVLERARAGIHRHKVAILALATIGADLATDAVRQREKGRGN